uniref:Caspase recruitment domain-containing protein 14 n=1 Tax=Geotrypetes seraphini TaxID=260995 RepID=A0A6P8SGK6_GEOSA|nr:caspase recruitment domain-containing protein 14 [Geotrypetes seraphini]XP_033817535.1 caspase recruitment domain-containing protein 14 [Geotrypetes seraphini]XP_033817536.1 caspase recruitment domain-containing protein 14 [Geotrypetes seraphini]XP_033817537.1 caspase recruitment domain-containing protein 14 [Geotrypetes seraphini]XP_033817538.1 caspase recruitment domain-containing protein 14 [Geotrypetes seraphini]
MDNDSPTDLEINELEEEELWDMIETHRCKIVHSLTPSRLTPYLRQAKVLDQLDEEEILHSLSFTNTAMRTGFLLDRLKTRGKNGAIAFLESLKLHKPEIYTLITGKEPSLDLNSFSGLIETSKLTECLAKAVGSLQDELLHEKCQKVNLLHQCRKMKEKINLLDTKNKSLTDMEEELHCLRRDRSAHYHEVLKLKDEKYELSMRYTSALQEKDLAITRCQELQEKIYIVKEELQRAQMDSFCEMQRSIRLKNDLQPKEDELLRLQEDNKRLHQSLEEQGKQGLQEEKDTAPESKEKAEAEKLALMYRIHALRGRAETAEKQKKQYLEEKETILVEYQKTKMDSEMYKEKLGDFSSQVIDLKKERDQAYEARDLAQAQVSENLAEKDSLRRQILELKEEIFELRHLVRTLEDKPEHREQLNSPTLGGRHQRLVRMDAICPKEDMDCSSLNAHESWQDGSNHRSSDLQDSVGSCSALAPCTVSLDNSMSYSSQESLNTLSAEKGDDTESEYEMLPQSEYSLPCFQLTAQGIHQSLGTEPGCPMISRRRYARRILSRTTVIAFQGDALLEQISIIGGNQTGVFIHQVTAGSAASAMALVPGSQIMAVDYDVMDPAYKAILEDATLEEALWILKRVKGFCCLSIRFSTDRYRKLVNEMENEIVTSGDSFYIRVNMSMEKTAGCSLRVQCNEILHITDTMYEGKCQWSAHRVSPYTMSHMESGIIPNYYQAQQLLIRAIQDMTWQNSASRKPLTGPQKLIRVVSTRRSLINPLWTSFDSSINEGPFGVHLEAGSCFTLMPYSIVKPHRPAKLRPIVFMPSLLGRILNEKLRNSKGFAKCEPKFLSDAEYETCQQNGDIIGEVVGEAFHCCITRQAMDILIKKNVHCLLDLSVDCVRALHRMELYPIVLHIPVSEKNAKKLKKPLQRPNALLECSRREEVLLDSLPYLHCTIAPDRWHDLDSLLGCVREAVTDEQKHIVWVHQDPHM